MIFDLDHFYVAIKVFIFFKIGVKYIFRDKDSSISTGLVSNTGLHTLNYNKFVLWNYAIVG